MLKVLEEVTVTFAGKNCELTQWPQLHPGEPPLVWVSQDESAYHSNDDVKSEWAEEGKGLTIKQKSRGSLLMVSMFVSELEGILRCTVQQRDAYISAHPDCCMAAKLQAKPDWDGSSTLILEPGAAPGKDKYFDADQLQEQTKLAMEVFEATHTMPGRWEYFSSRRGPTSNATYPYSFTPVWLPATPCKGLFFFDHSSGHGCFSIDALLASNANKNPDWKGSCAVMRDGYFSAPDGSRVAQSMQFKEGDTLGLDVTWPVGLHPHADPKAAPAPAPAAPPDAAPDTAPSPPTDTESLAAYKLFVAGTLGTLKKHNPTKTVDQVKALCSEKWDVLPTARKMVYVGRVRAKAGAAADPTQAPAERIIKAGELVPRLLWGRNKGTAIVLHERRLYPAAGLKGTCTSSKQHTDTNDCCCARLLDSQPDFKAECSALQHLIEQRVEMTLRHHCLFLPKVRPPLPPLPPSFHPLSPPSLPPFTTVHALRSFIAS